jgi:hypothetical protein
MPSFSSPLHDCSAAWLPGLRPPRTVRWDSYSYTLAPVNGGHSPTGDRRFSFVPMGRDLCRSCEALAPLEGAPAPGDTRHSCWFVRIRRPVSSGGYDRCGRHAHRKEVIRPSLRGQVRTRVLCSRTAPINGRASPPSVNSTAPSRAKGMLVCLAYLRPRTKRRKCLPSRCHASWRSRRRQDGRCFLARRG